MTVKTINELAAELLQAAGDKKIDPVKLYEQAGKMFDEAVKAAEEREKFVAETQDKARELMRLLEPAERQPIFDEFMPVRTSKAGKYDSTPAHFGHTDGICRVNAIGRKGKNKDHSIVLQMPGRAKVLYVDDSDLSKLDGTVFAAERDRILKSDAIQEPLTVGRTLFAKWAKKEDGSTDIAFIRWATKSEFVESEKARKARIDAQGG